MDELLRHLKENAQESTENLAKLLNSTPAEIQQRIADYEKQGIIRGYQTILNEDLLDLNTVRAVIEVRITPERERGFNAVAKRIAQFEEVESVHLMSGSYDLLVFVKGEKLQEVAYFVNDRLATIEGVLSTSTHFVLKKYKDNGVLMDLHEPVERLPVSS
ncbi:MAG: Lrp/AsnC family transcriptional regulator [Verrucomicrobia bacterium]|nr:Lrp/AsnC family transcriptional regulator [Verrucomicrobiota bacterium]